MYSEMQGGVLCCQGHCSERVYGCTVGADYGARLPRCIIKRDSYITTIFPEAIFFIPPPIFFLEIFTC